MNLTKELLAIIKTKDLRHDIVEIRISLMNTDSVHDQIVSVSNTSIPQMAAFIEHNMDVLNIAFEQIVKQLFTEMNKQKS